MQYQPYYQPPVNNTFIGYYINDYNDVLRTPAPMDGTGILFANLDQGLMWSKKLISGQAFIQQYSIKPINNTELPKQPTSQEDVLQQMLTKMESMEKEIASLKEVKKDESK